MNFVENNINMKFLNKNIGLEGGMLNFGKILKIDTLKYNRMFIVLIIIGCIGNYFSIPLYAPIHFGFGSIISFVILKSYGVTYGIVGSILINVFSNEVLQQPYGIIFIVETIIIGLFARYRKENIILLDSIYWIGIGIPSLGIYYSFLERDKLFILVAVFALCINGIFNTLIGNIMTTYIRIWDTKQKTTFEETTFNLISFCILFPSITMIIINKNNSINQMLKSFSILLVMMVIAFLCIFLISKGCIDMIQRLSKISSYLPKKVFHQRSVRWPKSRIEEISSLMTHLRSMNSALNKNFQEIQKEKERLENLVYYDRLTNLANKGLFKDRFNILLNQARRNNEKLAILFIDLDGFKRINDTMSHNVGDQLLKEFSNRLLACIDENKEVFRFGGDEFTVLLPKLEREEDIREMANIIMKITEKPWILNGQEFRITSSMGISVFPSDGNTIDVLLKNADVAMYRAKELGKNNYQFYTKDMNSTTFENLILENKLHKALERKELQIYYQPQIDLKTGKIIGIEALLRWINPELGFVSPGKFIPIAEETGLIIPIGEWVLRAACEQNKKWQNLGFPSMRMAVNISVHQFQQEDFVDKVYTILNETNLDPKWLEIEITESIAIKNVDFTIKTLIKLKHMGVKVSIDDFGTGFSSLGYLKHFKIDTLKIDYSFVKDIGMDHDNEAIIKAIIMLAKNLKLSVIAEGVETKEQLLFLQEENCDESQGFLFSKPVPAKDFENILIGENTFHFA